MRATVSDIKHPVYSSTTLVGFNADLRSVMNYYSFACLAFGEGMEMPGRRYSGEEYRWGFQAQEAENEIAGNGNYSFFKYRISDNRLGRFFALDPLSPEYPWNSPYAFSENQVINAVELEGLEKVEVSKIKPDGNEPATGNVTTAVDATARPGTVPVQAEEQAVLKNHQQPIAPQNHGELKSYSELQRWADNNIPQWSQQWFSIDPVIRGVPLGLGVAGVIVTAEIAAPVLLEEAVAAYPIVQQQVLRTAFSPSRQVIIGFAKGYFEEETDTQFSTNLPYIDVSSDVTKFTIILIKETRKPN